MGVSILPITRAGAIIFIFASALMSPLTVPAITMCSPFMSALTTACSPMVRVKHSLQGVAKVSVGELKEVLGKPDITILDVRDAPDWDRSNTMIPNAIRQSPDDINSWVDKYDKEQKLIVYCA